MTTSTNKIEASLLNLALLLGIPDKRGWRTRLAEWLGIKLRRLSKWIERKKIPKSFQDLIVSRGYPKENWLIDDIVVKIPQESSPDSPGATNSDKDVPEYGQMSVQKNEKNNIEPIINTLHDGLHIIQKIINEYDNLKEDHDEFRARLNAIEKDMKKEKPPDGKEHRKLWKKYMRLVK